MNNKVAIDKLNQALLLVKSVAEQEGLKIDCDDDERIFEMHLDDALRAIKHSMAMLNKPLQEDLHNVHDVWLLDLDGTVRGARRGKFPCINNQYIHHEAEQLMRHAKNRGIKLVAVSNQGGVEKGYKTIQDCQAEMEELNNILAPDATFDYICFCPHFDGDGTSVHIYDCSNQEWRTKEGNGYRKPAPGMLYLGCNLVSSFPSKALMVGDRQEDADAATMAAVDFIYAENWRSLTIQQ